MTEQNILSCHLEMFFLFSPLGQFLLMLKSKDILKKKLIESH